MKYTTICQYKHGPSRLAITNKKVALLNNSKDYELANAKSTSTPYKMLKRIGGARSCPEIKKKLEVCSPILTETYAASDLHRKQ